MSEHVLRVTRAADDENEAEYEIVCPNTHPGGKCTVWWECQECSKRADEPVDEEGMTFEGQLYEDGPTDIHGLPHQVIAGMICHEGKECIVLASEVEYDLDPNRLPVGDHPIEYESEELCTYVTFPELENVKFPDKETQR